MNKRFFAAFSLIAALLLSGCSLAQPEGEHAAAEEDRMVGVLVTREPLDLFDDISATMRDRSQTAERSATQMRSAIKTRCLPSGVKRSSAMYLRARMATHGSARKKRMGRARTQGCRTTTFSVMAKARCM